MLKMGELEEGLRFVSRGEFEAAFERLHPLAKQGELQAQLVIARLYFSGHGVEKDLDQYTYWLEQAAAQGDKAAKSKLKRLHRKES